MRELIQGKLRLPAIAILILVTILTAFGIPKLEVDTSFNSLISKDNPQKPIYERIKEVFGSDDSTIVYLRDKNLWTAEKLSKMEDLHYAISSLNFVERVDDIFNIRNIKGNKDGEVDSGLLLSESVTDQKAIEEAKADGLQNPIIKNNLLSSDGNGTAIIVAIKENHGNKHYDEMVNSSLKKIIAPYKDSFDELFYVGSQRINSELRTTLYEDLLLLGPLSAIGLVLATLLFLRSGFASIMPLLSASISIIWTLGFMGWFNVPLNVLSAMLPSLIIVIGSTEGTHMMATWFQNLYSGGLSNRKQMAINMMSHLALPLIMTLLTTTLGFAANILTSISLIQDFAIASTFAILANGCITLVFVPMALAHFGPTENSLFKYGGEHKGIQGMFIRAYKFLRVSHPRLLIFGTAFVCVLFLYQALSLYVTNDPLSYFQKDQQIVKDMNRLESDLTGARQFYITLESPKEKAFLKPKNIQLLADIQGFIKKQGAMDRSISLADYLSLVNREFHRGDEKYHNPPKRRNLIAQYLLFFHKSDIEQLINHDFSHANIIVRHSISDSATLNKYIKELKNVISNLTGVGFQVHITGKNLMINGAAESIMVAQVKSLLLLLVVIFLLMSLLFTSFRGGFIALIPNMIPIILLFGSMGLLGIPLNPGTVMVAVIAIGITIDGTIHLLSCYNDLCRKTSNLNSAVQSTVEDEATPMVVTSIALAIGFGVLIFSNLTLVAQFGALAATTMLFSLFANLLVLPVIMSRNRLVGLYQILAMSMDRDVLGKSPLFDGMSEYQIRKTILIAEMQEFKKGDVVVKQGSYSRCMYMLLSGSVDVIRIADERETKLTTLNAGEVFGEIGYIVESERTADVRAVTSVRMLRFDYDRLKGDLKFFPRIVALINFNISTILGKRLASTTAALEQSKRQQ